MVHLIWTGRGWVVPAASFGLSLASEVITRSVTGEEDYYQQHALPLGLALLMSALIIFIVYVTTIRLIRDGDGKAVKIARPAWLAHSCFFVSIAFWPVILVAITAILFSILGP